MASLRTTASADGSYRVAVNDRRAIRLSPQLGTFLELIAAPGREAEDGLVGWRTKAELAAALRKRSGGNERSRDVPKIVYRLRKAFEAAGENALLIQTNRARGIRFAVRAGGWNEGAPTPGDPR